MKNLKFLSGAATVLFACALSLSSCSDKDNAAGGATVSPTNLPDMVEYTAPGSDGVVVVHLPMNAEITMDRQIMAKYPVKIVGPEGVPAVITPAEGANFLLSGGIELENVVIDASNISEPLFLMNPEPTAPKLNNTDYLAVDNVILKNVLIGGVKNSLFYDNNKKYCVVNFAIENSIVKLATEKVENEAIISFKAGGAKDITIKNSTIYGNNAVAKYFVRFNNSARLDRYGYDKNATFHNMTYENNTFHGLLKSDGQWGNYSAIAGQNYVKFVVKNNIWNNCGVDIIRRMAGGRFGGSAPLEFENNTYWNNGAANNESGYDKSGTILTTDPAFVDAENDNFTIQGVDQVLKQTGDPRWIPTELPFEYVKDGDLAEAIANTKKAMVIVEGNCTLSSDVVVPATLKEIMGYPTAKVTAAGGLTVSDALAVKNLDIDATALTAPLVQLNTLEDGAAVETIDAITFENVNVAGLQKAIFYSAGKQYLITNLSYKNCVVEVAADVTVFDFTKGSAAATLAVENSTFYAPTATTKSMYSSQSGQKLIEVDPSGTQTFKFANSTVYNFAKAKNFFTHRQSNQKWLAYDVQGNIFVNCGKSGQVVKGMNGGQSGANPIWTIKGNVFNFDDADTSVDESTGDDAEPVQESIAAVVKFADAENGDFTQAEAQAGDPRWISK